MWLKFGKRVYNLFDNQRVEQKKNPQDEAAQLIKIATSEVEVAIRKHEATLLQTVTNQREIAKQLQHHKTQSDRLYAEAAQYLKKNQDGLAQQMLNQKALEDKQVEQYNALLQNINQVVQQLESQLAKMRWQLQEIKSREIIMTARMQNAKTQMELNEYLIELDTTLNLGLENEVIKTEMQAEIVNGISESDKVLAETQGQFLLQQQMQDLEKGLKETEEKERKQREANQQKRIEQLLGTTPEKEKKAAAEQERLKEEQKRKLVEQVFNAAEEKNLQASNEKQRKQQLLEEWEKNTTTTKIEPTDNKKSLLDSFFNDKQETKTNEVQENNTNEKPKDKPNDKQSLIDDFFK